MKKIIPFLLVGVPFCLSVIFIANTIESQTFPLLRKEMPIENQNINEAYKAGLEYCEKSFQTSTISEKNKLKECAEVVERWYLENKPK